MNTSIDDLLRYSRREFRKQAFETGSLPSGSIPFSDSIGVHLYSDLRVGLSLSAADRLQTAQLYLQVLQAYASAAEATSIHANIRILEVQGRRLHLFKSMPQVNEVEWNQTLEACRVFYQLAKRKIEELVGGYDFTIRMAADWGRAVLLLSSGEDESESIVSLGVPANRPAKHLAREVGKKGVPAGHLAFNQNAVVDPNGAPSWVLVDLEEKITRKSASDESTLLAAANSRYNSLVESEIMSFSRSFSPNPKNPVCQPLVRQGFMFRADLDGFSKRVQNAMNGGSGDVLNLVREFHLIMQYPAAFKDQLPHGVKVLQFPWAGDCANMLLECDNYSLERTSLPNVAALKWHDQGRVSGGANWCHLIRDTKWLVAMAGGDNHGADHGFIVTGNIMADSRAFHVGAGWGWQRSLDAEQSEGTAPEDTVIQIEDHQGLDEIYRDAYREHEGNPSLFKVSPYNQLRRNYLSHQAALRTAKPALHVASGLLVPAPKPYAEF